VEGFVFTFEVGYAFKLIIACDDVTVNDLTSSFFGSEFPTISAGQQKDY
jgi:hypothetical protein